jgi:hypothetical protein
MKKLGMGKLWMLQGESTPNILGFYLIICLYTIVAQLVITFLHDYR